MVKSIDENSVGKKMNMSFYSENCCGQNKNKYIATVYLHTVSKLANNQSITHKYLIQGHTQNEGDNGHSLIEREIKKNLKSGPIYTPHQYIPIIKCAKKTGTPLTVHELGFDFFKDLKDLQENWGYNYNENERREPVIWNDIKVLKFCKDEPFSIFCKPSYTEDNFQTINLRNKRKKNIPDIMSITLKEVYSRRLDLTENKKRGLRELISRNLIKNSIPVFMKILLSKYRG